MGIRKALSAVCIIVITTEYCKAQYRPFSDTFGFSSPFSNFGYRGLSDTQEVQPEYNTNNHKNGSTFDGLTSRIFSVLSNRWNGIEDQIEQRLDQQPEHVAERVETRVEQARDNIERAQDRQQNSLDNFGWGSFLSNIWNSFDDGVENRVDAVENKIENTYGEQAADTFENIWDDATDRNDENKRSDNDNTDDAFDDDKDDWFDDVFDDDYNDNWDDDSFDNDDLWDNDNSWDNDKSWDNDDSGDNHNFWENDNNDWSNTNSWGTGSDDFWDDFS